MVLSIAFAGAAGLVLTPRLATRAGGLSMAIEKLPGEGDPFSPLCPAVDSYGNTENSVKRMDEGFGRWHMDTGYIENDDEPWHSTCVATTGLVKSVADETFAAALPFIAPEEDLLVALSKVASVGDIDAAVKAALAAGARPGCPAIMDAEKIKKSAKDGAVKAGKAPKVAAQGTGWDDMARALGKVHDNSI